MATGAIRYAVMLAALAWLSGPAAGGAAPDCRCRYAGETYLQGQCVCMRISGRQRYACCGKVLNNASWKFSDDACPTAMSREPARPDTAAGPKDPAGARIPTS